MEVRDPGKILQQIGVGVQKAENSTRRSQFLFIVGGLKFNLFYLKKFVLQPDVIGGCKLCVKKKKEAI